MSHLWHKGPKFLVVPCRAVVLKLGVTTSKGVAGLFLRGREIQYNLKVHLGDIIKIYFARRFMGHELNGELLGGRGRN